MSTSLRRAPPPPGLRPLLSHFPAPPSFIPPSPVAASPALRMPPSGPPSAPLPPVPEGPSTVSDAAQLAFLTMRRASYASSRSRQSSASSDEHSVVAVSPAVSAVRVPACSSPDTPSPHTSPVDSLPDPRADSPDIAVLIERTPRSSTPALRPARRSRSSHSSSGRSSAPGIKRLRSSPALGVALGVYARPRPWAPAPAPPDDDPDTDTDPDSWDDIWEEPPAPPAHEEDSEDDVIDLRTPLPHLMLRAGLLSPHSKLLPRPAASPEPPRPAAPAPRPLPRDERDTLKRRERHKDGKLLRGGIGLTTGLGWSDSEDEDAPSALTHRLSRLAPTLSRKSSMASSLASARAPPPPAAAPLSRSASAASTLSALSAAGDVPAYPYAFAPPSPTDPGHDPLPLVAGPGVWRAPRSPLFDDADPFARHQAPATAPAAAPPFAPAPAPPYAHAPAFAHAPATAPPFAHAHPHALLPPRTRPPSKALPPLPLPKTASLSSLRERAPSNASVASVASVRSAASVRARPSLPNARAAAAAVGRPRTTSTSSVGSAGRPLKPAIKPARGGGGRFAYPADVVTGIAI